MKIKYFVFIALVVVCFSNCQKSTEPIGNDKPPPGYQEDIHWPSLAESPWPMSRHDPQSTGRSKEIGPTFGVIDWSIEPYWLETGLSIGPDSTIYFNYGDLFAYSPDGEEKWILELNQYGGSAPIIAADGTIYTTAGVKLIAISADKTIKWEYIDEYVLFSRLVLGWSQKWFRSHPLCRAYAHWWMRISRNTHRCVRN